MSIKADGIEFNPDLMTFPNSYIRDCKYYILLEFVDAIKYNKSNDIMVIHFI